MLPLPPPRPAPTPFEQLLRAARDGSREALGLLFDVYRPALVRLARAHLSAELQPKGGASDLVQETFIDAQRGFPFFRGRSQQEVHVWLRQILVRNLSSFRRHYLDRSKRRATREVSLDNGRIGGDLRDELAEDSSGPPTDAIDREQTSRLRNAILALPSPYSRVIRLHSYDRLPFEKIGRELGCSAEAARKLHSRALRRLASLLR
jgi:RNA polymerase sigma-70 factor (ECF subfamily)